MLLDINGYLIEILGTIIIVLGVCGNSKERKKIFSTELFGGTVINLSIVVKIMSLVIFVVERTNILP